MVILAAPTGEPTITLSLVQSLTVIIAFLLVWGGVFWRKIKADAEKETKLYAAIEKNAVDINAVGARVNGLSTSCSLHEKALNDVNVEQQTARDNRETMRESIGRNSAAIAALREDLQEERMSVMTTLHNNEKAAAERDAQMRERLASITERLDIERMVTSVVRALQKD
jgi:chromosome segregation ATPase